MRGIAMRLGLLAAVALLNACPSASTEPPDPVATVTIDPPSASIHVGATAQLSAVTRTADGSEVSGRFCNWYSSNDHLATVSENGLARAIAVGTVTVI